MKNVTYIFLVIAIIMLIPNSMQARRRGIPLGEREVLSKVHDFPDTEDYQLENGQFMDLATLHKEFNIAYILPLYVTEEPKLVGYDESDDTYYEFENADMDAILVENNLDKDDMLKLPLYTRFGGKGLALLLISLIAYGYLKPRKEKEITPKKL